MPQEDDLKYDDSAQEYLLMLLLSLTRKVRFLPCRIGNSVFLFSDRNINPRSLRSPVYPRIIVDLSIGRRFHVTTEWPLVSREIVQ